MCSPPPRFWGREEQQHLHVRQTQDGFMSLSSKSILSCAHVPTAHEVVVRVGKRNKAQTHTLIEGAAKYSRKKVQ